MTTEGSASVLVRARWGLRDVLAGAPSVYLPLARWRHGVGGAAEAVSGATEIVIEGYPRSGNTFAVIAFRMAQDRPMSIAHHLHAPAQVLRAARRTIPSLVLIRDPEDAVLSTVLWHRGLSVENALRSYVRFYSRVNEVRDAFVVASFEDVRKDFGAVIRGVNERFGTAFEPFDHTEENEARCFAMIDEDNARHLQEGHYGQGQSLEAVSARPSAVREEMKERLADGFRSPALKGLLADARIRYADLVSTAS